MRVKSVPNGAAYAWTIPWLLMAALLATTGCQEASSTDVNATRISAEGALPAMARDTARGAYVHTFVAKETFANGWFGAFDPISEDLLYGNLWVARGGTGRGRMTWLAYWVEQCRVVEIEDWWSWECDVLAEGWGTIPNGDLKGNARAGGLSLDTNTAADPDFFGTGGAVSLKWQPSGWFSHTTSGTQKWRMGRTTSMSSGTSHNSEAAFTGSIGGVEVPEGSWGWIGNTNQLHLTVERPLRP